MNAEPKGSTAILTHYGRRSGKPYQVKVWFVVVDGEVWIGSLDSTRGWVRNVHASARAAIDFGSGPRPVACEPVGDPDAMRRFAEAVREKYPIMSRILALFVRGDRCAFRLRPVES